MDVREYSEGVRELVREIGRCDIYASVAGLTDRGRELLRQMERDDKAAVQASKTLEFEAELYGTGSYKERGQMVRTINLATMDMSLPTESRRYHVALTPIEREPEPASAPSPDRYPMCADQPAQIDCRRSRCRFHDGAGQCTNPSPAITLNAPPTMTNEKGVCWAYKDRESAPKPPDWADAPDWASARAQNQNGTWYWHHRRPEEGSYAWRPTGHHALIQSECIYNPNWRDTLQERPAPEPFVPPWDDAPEWARQRTQDEDGTWRWWEWSPMAHISRWLRFEGETERAGTGTPNPNWRDTLQGRPESEPEPESPPTMWIQRNYDTIESDPVPLCPVCGKPAGEHRDGLWCCPHCGREAAKIRHKLQSHVHCCYCGSNSASGTSLKRVIAAWNRRA